MIVLITGGASGLGEAITRKLAHEPDLKVYFTYANSADRAREIEAAHENAKGLKCDFKNIDEVNELAAQVAALNIDVLINNAYTGDFLKSYFHKTPASDLVTAFTDNIVPTVTLTQAAINTFRKKKFGKIITISTAALLNIPPIGSAVYVANKAYMEQLAKVWASENIKFNITSNILSPAFMSTGFTSSIDERMVDQIIDSHPLKKLLTVDEVADSVLFLVKASQQINGINLVMNAGANII